MTIAPIVIPTLCRYNHFKNCIESLKHCTLANKSPLIVGLDYPREEKHVNGYRKIKLYLDELIPQKYFKCIDIIIRNHNYGLGIDGNINTLIDETLLKYDRFIFSEDDNIFSPNFLDFINKGLNLFKDNTSILAINGYRHNYNLKFGNNTYFKQNIDFSAWGYGMWKNRWTEIRQLQPKWFREQLTLNNIIKIKFHQGNNRLIDLYGCARNPNFNITDNMLSVYMALTGKFVIMPLESLVRNEGWDGSGKHCQTTSKEIIEGYHLQQISNQNTFEYIGTGDEFKKTNLKVYRKESIAKISDYNLIRRILNRFN